jgi:adenosylcobinamide-phosphate synthase
MTDFFSLYNHLYTFLPSPDRIPLAMAAILLAGIVGIVTGPLMGNANPFFWILVDRIPGRFGARLDRAQRKPADLMLRGFLLTVFSLILFYIAGQEARRLVRAFPFEGFTEIFLLSLTLSCGSVWLALLKIFFAMKNRTLGKNAYYIMARTTRNDLSASDDFTITRVGMGLAARAFDKGIVAPVIWYIIAGLPGAYIYAGLAALAWRFGKEGFTKGFGRIPLALEQLMGFIPSLLAGVLMALAGLLTPTGGMTRAFAGLARRKGHAPYAQGGLPVTAMSSALKVSLGGPTVDLEGSAIKRAWAGPEDATAQLEPGHLRRAIYISLMAHLLFLAGMGACMLYLDRVHF